MNGNDANAVRIIAIQDAIEGIESFHSPHGNPDGYCACDEESQCYLHGVTIPAALRATESIAADLRSEARKPRQAAA